MSAPVFIAWFEEEAAVLEAVRAARAAGFDVHDVYGPHPVHGMDEAMGLRPSRLTWVCFGAALTGLAVATWLQDWTSAYDWALNVGGKPTHSIPAFVPVMFELTVLFAALITVSALFLRSGLRPRVANIAIPARVTEDRFALALTARGHRFDADEAAALCIRHGAVETAIEEVAS